ncbi:MAG TPA: hypothetical protein VFP10_10710, partial [Candidatus Eisenbacteria bacterium]|nr:hypothetical protein [Candidatus Eisenbacteria bacterium]
MAGTDVNPVLSVSDLYDFGPADLGFDPRWYFELAGIPPRRRSRRSTRTRSLRTGASARRCSTSIWARERSPTCETASEPRGITGLAFVAPEPASGSLLVLGLG